MLNRICWLHRKINHDQKITVNFGNETVTSIFKDDILRKDDNCITVLRPKGDIIVINPDKVCKIYTTNRKEWL